MKLNENEWFDQIEPLWSPYMVAEYLTKTKGLNKVEDFPSL